MKWATKGVVKGHVPCNGGAGKLLNLIIIYGPKSGTTKLVIGNGFKYTDATDSMYKCNYHAVVLL